MFEGSWEQKLITNIRENTNYILEKYYGNNQAQMAKELGVKPNTLYTYLNTDTKPPVTFIYRLCSSLNLSIDLFLNDELAVDLHKTRKREAAKQFYSKFAGSYYTYFLVIDSNSLKEGLVQEGCMDIGESGSLSYEILNAGKQFTGILSASEELVYFDLKNPKEKLNIVIKNPGKSIREKYVGGMGIANISSPEDNRIPGAQKVIISSKRIPVDKYYTVLSEYLRINTYVKIRKRLLTELLEGKLKSCGEDNSILQRLQDSKISMEDKIAIEDKDLFQLQQVLDDESFLTFKSYVLNGVSSGDILHFNSIKVNIDEDKMIYRFIKNEFR